MTTTKNIEMSVGQEDESALVACNEVDCSVRGSVHYHTPPNVTTTVLGARDV